MGVKMKLTGQREFLAALRKTNREYGTKFRKGAVKAGAHLKKEIKKVTPVDTGALKASTVSYVFGAGWDSQVWVGQGAEVSGYFDEYGREKNPFDYAVYRHEGQYATRLWFDDILFNNSNTVIDIIQGEMQK